MKRFTVTLAITCEIAAKDRAQAFDYAGGMYEDHIRDLAEAQGREHRITVRAVKEKS